MAAHSQNPQGNTVWRTAVEPETRNTVRVLMMMMMMMTMMTMTMMTTTMMTMTMMTTIAMTR